MKKNRILSSLLCLSLAAGLLIPGLPAYAEGEGESSNSGMELSKTAVANADGTYTITLEAYATGEKLISSVNKDVPTDIVLVLDQSGSMDTKDFPSVGQTTYTPYTGKQTKNSNLYSKRHNNNGRNGNLYYQLDDGSYATVSVVRTRENSYTYTPCPSDWQNYKDRTYQDWNPDCYWKYSNNLYVKNEAGVYQKVTVTYENTAEWYEQAHYVYTYTFPNGNVVTSDGNDGQPGSKNNNNFDGNGPVYYLSSTTAGEYTYTYTCTDAEGNTINIGTSTGEDTNFTDKTLYYRTVTNGSNIKRLEALVNAVTAFTNSVANKAKGADGKLGTPDDIDHRIAVVGFASKDDYGNNTELLSIAGSNSGDVGIAYDSISNQNLEDVLQKMNTTTGQTMVTKAISALAAQGATETNLGMDMAQRILEKNPVPEGQQRNRVVVVFTDGAPTTFNGFEKSVANDAISKANAIKNKGVTVYSVGIFPGADPTSSGTEPGGDLRNDSSSIPAASNWFMQKLSSNNGTPQTPSYYLAAANSSTLNNIFQQISDNIESGGSSTTLDSSAVIKDIISPAFALPEGATASDIKLETYKCTGKSGDAYTWEKNPDAMGATATVNGDQVSVTGFNFAENYVGTVTENGNTTYRGNKLVIKFNVSPKAGFLGGNNVYTNTSAGVYENAEAKNPVLEFNRPQVNVPIKDVTVDAVDKNVYLLGTVTAAQLQEGATVTVGNVSLDLSADNYGLETWQNEYVDITVEIKDEEGNVISDDLADLKDDVTYTVEVTVKPKTDGTGASGEPNSMNGKSGNDTAKINVYKPELTYQDSEVFYGDNLPTNFDTYNRTATKWKHGETEANDSKMGDAPALTVTYAPDATKISDNKIASTEDIPVAATVKIGDTDVTGKTTFLHTDCVPACGWNETTLDGSPAFLLHVKTATLKITKEGADGNKNEGFIFEVKGPNNLTFRVSVKDNGTVKITGLPLGEYTVTEDEGWSWRYTATGPAQAMLTEAKPDGEVIIQNAKDKSYLLDGSAYAQNNSVRPAAGN